MGQEQSYAHASATQLRRYKEKYEDPIHYRHSSVDFDYESDYKRHRIRRSGDSFKSDNSSTESSGYRSGSNSTYEYRSASERSNASDYYRLSIYKNDHYKDVNKELYKPVKIPKEKRYKYLDIDKSDSIKTTRLKSYLSESEKAKLKAGPNQAKKSGIRNYTPKILSEEEQKKKLDNWI